jgi:hypothetical protein
VIGEHHRREGRRREAGELDDADARQRFQNLALMTAA